MSYKFFVRSLEAGVILSVCSHPTADFVIRAYVQYYNNAIDWDIVPLATNIELKSVTNIEHLFSASEEELFQESCTVPYNPYYVKAGIEYIRKYIDSHYTINSLKIITTDIELEY